jgi:hypothetical protein
MHSGEAAGDRGDERKAVPIIISQNAPMRVLQFEILKGQGSEI